MDISCFSCRFSDLPRESEPCRDCLELIPGFLPFSKWEPKEDDELTRLRAEVARLREAARWIPVSERLPEEGKLVLIIYANNRVIGWFDIDGEWRKIQNHWITDVTHWMPLPEPPEVE